MKERLIESYRFQVDVRVSNYIRIIRVTSLLGVYSVFAGYESTLDSCDLNIPWFHGKSPERSVAIHEGLELCPIVLNHRLHSFVQRARTTERDKHMGVDLH